MNAGKRGPSPKSKSQKLDDAVRKVQEKEAKAKGNASEAGRSPGFRIWQGRKENA